MNTLTSARVFIVAIFALAIILSFSSMPAQASIIYDTSLAAPGVYFGSGNANVDFAVSTTPQTFAPAGVLELGLSAINRYIGPVDGAAGNYYVPTGPTTVAGKSGSEWGFDFSINTNVGGTGAALLSNYTFLITITDTTAPGDPTAAFNPLSITDNTYYNGAVLGTSATPPASAYGAQNSEPASLLSLFPTFLPAYNMNAADTYEITLSANPTFSPASFGDPSVTIFVHAQNAVPEPATFVLAGTALLGLGLLRRKIKV